MPVAKKGRSVVFTLNNWTDGELASLSGKVPDQLRYFVAGKEVGESGTPHLQGYAYTEGQRTHAWFKTLIGNRAHIEFTKGTHEQAISYCKKDGDFVELGNPPKAPSAVGADELARWEAARKSAKAGTLDDIPADIYLRMYRTLKEVAKDHMCVPEDLDKLSGVWITGLAGCGKSRKAREDYPGSYLKMANKWWDGYQAHKTVILDDIDKHHHVLGHHLKIWTDRYAFLAENKGGAIAIRPDIICVTSQYTIEDIWEDVETRAALNRRFTVIKM